VADGGTDGRRFFFTRTRQATSTEEIDTSRRPAAAHTAQSPQRQRDVRRGRFLSVGTLPRLRFTRLTGGRVERGLQRAGLAVVVRSIPRAAPAGIVPLPAWPRSYIPLGTVRASWQSRARRPCRCRRRCSRRTRSAGAAVVATRRCDRKWARPNDASMSTAGGSGRRPWKKAAAATSWMVHREEGLSCSMPSRSTASGGEKGQLLL